MLGFGSLFYTSEEETYATENKKRFNSGVLDASADYDDMIPHYLIPSSRPSFKVNTLRKNFMRGGFRTFSDDTEKGVGEVTGSFDVALSDYTGTKKILQLFMGLTEDTHGVADWSAGEIKAPTDDVKSMTIYQTYPNNTSLLSKFTGMCINSLSMSVSGNDTYPILSFDFLGKDEEFVTATGSLLNFHDKTKVDYAFNDVFPAWTTLLEMDLWGDSNWQKVFMYDFDFTINNNLSFPQYSADDRTHSRKPVTILREVTGSFNLVGTDETSARIDDIALLLNKIKTNTPVKLRLKIQDQKELDYFQFNMDKVFMLSGGVFDGIDYGELRIPISFIAEDGADDGKDYTIKYGRNS